MCEGKISSWYNHLGISSLKQLADVFSKLSGTVRFKSLVMQLGIQNMYTLPACGNVEIEESSAAKQVGKSEEG